MIIGDALDLTEDQLNVVIYVDGYPPRRDLQPHHISVSRDEFYDSEDYTRDFRDDVLREGYYINRVFPVYHQGWECDQWAAEVTKDGKTYFLTTNHGSIEVEEQPTFIERVVRVFKGE